MGLVGLGVSYAQGSAPAAPAACLMGRGAGPRGGLPQAAGWRWGGSMPQVWADALGMTLDEFAAAVQGGKTVAALAEEKGLTVEVLVDKAMEARQAALQQAVADGRLTRAQADAMLEQMRTNMAERLQNGGTPGANCPRLDGQGAGAQLQRGRMGRFGRGMRCAAPAAQP